MGLHLNKLHTENALRHMQLKLALCFCRRFCKRAFLCNPAFALGIPFSQDHFKKVFHQCLFAITLSSIPYTKESFKQSFVETCPGSLWKDKQTEINIFLKFFTICNNVSHCSNGQELPANITKQELEQKCFYQ